MSIVIDSNLVVTAATDETVGPAIVARLREWRAASEALHAPWLFRYEVANSLARYVATGYLTQSQAEDGWQRTERIARRVTFHDIASGPRVIAITQQLKRQSAYDAAYIALAEELNTDVWTIDGPLARNAEQAGLPVKLIEAG